MLIAHRFWADLRSGLLICIHLSLLVKTWNTISYVITFKDEIEFVARSLRYIMYETEEIEDPNEQEFLNECYCSRGVITRST